MGAIFDLIWQRKVVFFSTFFVVFSLSYIVLLAIDFVPETSQEAADPEQTEVEFLDEGDTMEAATEPTDVLDNVDATTTIENVEPAAVLPLAISIAKLDRRVTVLNPTSRTVADLDTALLEGVVRHPDSAALAQDGNVFILGHSSYLPQVFNKNFQAFNGIQDLEWGDTIEVTSADTVYEYRVEKVYRAKAQDITVPIAGTGRMLTLATCNSFGTVDDRYIVEAKQIGERRL